MTLSVTQIIVHPFEKCENINSAWEKSNGSLFRVVGKPMMTFLALETMALMALVYHSVVATKKSGQLAAKIVLLHMPIARLQMLGKHYAKDLTWETIGQDHVVPTVFASYQVIAGGLTAILASPTELSNIKHVILPELHKGRALSTRAWSIVKQPKVLATIAVGASLVGLWALYSSGRSETTSYDHFDNTTHDTSDNFRKPKDITLGTTYINDNNSQRKAISWVINQNHSEYATRWDLHHEVEDSSLLRYQCTVRGLPTHCEAYWNKVAVLNRWLDRPAVGDKEEWYIMVDDDMAITNMSIDPNEALIP